MTYLLMLQTGSRIQGLTITLTASGLDETIKNIDLLDEKLFYSILTWHLCYTLNVILSVCQYLKP